MLNACFLLDEALPFRLQLRPLPVGKPFSLGAARITAIPTSHLARTGSRFRRIYASDFSAFSFLLEAGGRRVAHSADLGRPEDLALALQKPLDLLVCELAYFAPIAMFACLQGRKIKRVAFVHVGRPFRADLARIRRVA